ncbi:MAG: putative O-glycosylation ligase, exosortase A system-associated [Rhodospirillaceae bacterium]|nr:putative O-glycosylation ligase, exosortase A system-associated [Rhodospirillaceae bacterium]
MRDIALILFLAFSIALMFRAPIIGLFVWIWLSLMNPHQMVYGIVAGASLNQIVAGLTLIALLSQGALKKIPINAVMILMIVFGLWFTLTTFTVATSPSAYELWDRNVKTIILVFAITALATTRERLHATIWVFVISIGFYGALNGAKTIVSGGASKLAGPPNSMIHDNNHLALAIVISLPLMNYLFLHSKHRLVRIGLLAGMFLSMIGVMGSYSRGGFVAASAMLGLLWIRSHSKMAIAAIGIVVALGVVSFMPTEYRERLSTISDAQEDTSFQQRLLAWAVAVNVAVDMPLGAGFEGPIQENVWNRYSPGTTRHAAHSIYMMVLGEQGFTGLFIYLLLCWTAWRSCDAVRKQARGRPELAWAYTLSSMIQVSFFGFLIGGAALSMSYYDGFLILVGIAALLPRLALAYASDDAKVRPRSARFRSPALAHAQPQAVKAG